LAIAWLFLLFFEITGFCLKRALGIKSAKYIANKRSMEVTTMKKGAILIITAILAVCLHSPAQANVITFDDITSGITNVNVPNNYAGFNWLSEAQTLYDGRFMGVFGNGYSAPSANYAIFNKYGIREITITFNELIDFSGAYFSGWGINNNPAKDGTTATSVTVLGYQGESFVDSRSMNLATNQYNWLTANLLGIDRLVIQSSSDRTWWLMDDFSYDTPINNATAPVPEPTTLLLLGSGLMGIAGIRKKFKKS
jgi:hypothetical protein